MSLQDAEARLAELEGPRQRFHNARHWHESLKTKLERAKEVHPDFPELIAATSTACDEAAREHAEAEAAYRAHRAEHGEDLSRHIDAAAQAVIDARSETATEGN